MPVTFRRPYPAYRANGYAAISAQQPMSEMNTTPLIDVLLVLLIMIIMTVPLATHTLEVDLPSDRGKATDAPQVSLTISAGGQAYWNGEAVSRAMLQQHLDAAMAQPVEPVIRFEPDPQTSYDASVQIIAQVREAGINRFAFIGNERSRTFARD